LYLEHGAEDKEEKKVKKIIENLGKLEDQG